MDRTRLMGSVFLVAATITCLMLGRSVAQETKSITAYEGTKVNILCDTKGIKPTFILWTKDNNRLPTKSTEHQIPRVQYSDSGKYTCTFYYPSSTGSITSFALHYTLSVKSDDDNGDSMTMGGGGDDLPEIKMFVSKDLVTDPSRVFSINQTYFYIKCNPKDVGYLTLDKDNQPLNLNNGLYYKTNIKPSDSGVYRCQIKMPDGRRVEKSAIVKVEDLKLVVTPIPGENLVIGGRILRRCEGNLVGLNDNGYSWRDPMGRITQGQVLQVPIDKNTRKGIYTCTYNSERFKASTLVDIQFDVPEDLSLRIDTLSSESLVLGGQFDRKCSLKTMPTRFNYRFQWLDPRGNVVSQNEFLRASIKPETNLGTYTCQLIDYNTQRTVASATVELVISQPRRVDQTNLKLTQRPADCLSGQICLLYCESESVTGPTYEWYYRDQPLGEFSNTRSNQQPHTLITEVEKNGEYMCKMTAGKSSITGADVTGEARRIIYVQDESNIDVTPRGEYRLLPLGSHHEIHCDTNVRGAKIQWYFEGELITPNTMYRLQLDKRDEPISSIITVKNMTLLNEGKYECRVNGQPNGFTVIKLAGIVTSIKHDRTSLPTKVGQYAEFHCQMNGYRDSATNVDVKWTFRDRNGRTTPLDVSRWKRRDQPNEEHTAFIIIENAEMRDSGYYICTAPDGKSDTAELIVDQGRIVTISPKRITVRPRTPVNMFCESTLNNVRSGNPNFYFPSPERPVVTDTRFTVRTSGDGNIELIVAGGLEEQDRQVDVICKDEGAQDDGTIIVDAGCQQGYRACKDSRCIEFNRFCDGVRDCLDNSDEDPAVCDGCDPIVKKCENHMGQTSRKPNFLVHWKCDGEDDCGNGYDEDPRECNAPEYTSCGGKEKQCRNEQKSIPLAFVCDAEQDCIGGDDELNCVKPSIPMTSLSQRQFKVRQMGSVTLTCEASGEPLPRIVWRFNWGCLGDKVGQRMIVTNRRDGSCRTVTSQLTIRDFRPDDAGIYNCEALSGQQRAMSEEYMVSMTQ